VSIRSVGQRPHHKSLLWPYFFLGARITPGLRQSAAASTKIQQCPRRDEKDQIAARAAMPHTTSWCCRQPSRSRQPMSVSICPGV